MLSRHRTSLLLLLAFAGITTLGVTPASASTTVLQTSATDGFVRVYGVGEAQTIPVGATADVVISCQAVASDVVESTGVGCYLIGVIDGKGYYMTQDGWLPGIAAQTTERLTGLPAQPYRLCMGLGYRSGSTFWQWLPHGPENCTGPTL